MGQPSWTLSVSDGTTTQTQTIVVNVSAVDDSPVLGAIPSQEFSEDGSVTVNLTKYVADKDTDFS